jgi:hypothetical protein
MQRGRRCPRQGALRRQSLVGGLKQPTLVHALRKAQEQCLIDIEKFANQDEAQ